MKTEGIPDYAHCGTVVCKLEPGAKEPPSYCPAPRNEALLVKDRVMGHNPAAALYTSHSYYRRLTDS